MTNSYAIDHALSNQMEKVNHLRQAEDAQARKVDAHANHSYYGPDHEKTIAEKEKLGDIRAEREAAEQHRDALIAARERASAGQHTREKDPVQQQHEADKQKAVQEFLDRKAIEEQQNKPSEFSISNKSEDTTRGWGEDPQKEQQKQEQQRQEQQRQAQQKQQPEMDRGR